MSGALCRTGLAVASGALALSAPSTSLGFQGVPRPPSSPAVVAIVVESAWYGPVSDKEVEWRGRIALRNLDSVPIHSPRVMVTLSYKGRHPAISKYVQVPSFQGVANITQDVLLPFHNSRPMDVSMRVPMAYWRRGYDHFATCTSYKRFDYKKNLRDPQSLQAFLYCEKTVDVLKAFDRDPSLMKVRTKNGAGPVLMAVVQHDVQMVKALEKRGGKISEVTKPGLNALHFAALSTPEMVRYVASRGVKPKLTTESKRSALDYAIESNNPRTIPELLKAGVSPNTRDSRGNTPVLNAIHYGNPELFQALHRGGGRLDVFNNDGIGPIGMCVVAYRAPMLAAVRAAGGNPNERDPKTRRTPLHLAVMVGRVDAAVWLVRSGAKLDVKDRDGRTPRDLVELRRHEGDKRLWLDYFRRIERDRNAPFWPGR